MLGWTIFYNPMSLPFNSLLWLLLPLCGAVAIIYKTCRVGKISRLWPQIISLLVYMVVGLAALCVVLWVVLELAP